MRTNGLDTQTARSILSRRSQWSTDRLDLDRLALAAKRLARELVRAHRHPYQVLACEPKVFQ
jgi:hypothetical protein